MLALYLSDTKPHICFIEINKALSSWNWHKGDLGAYCIKCIQQAPKVPLVVTACSQNFNISLYGSVKRSWGFGILCACTIWTVYIEPHWYISLLLKVLLFVPYKQCVYTKYLVHFNCLFGHTYMHTFYLYKLNSNPLCLDWKSWRAW